MASTQFSLDPNTTALVLIDLQRGIVARDTKPYTAAQVVERAARLTKRFRDAGALVVLVRVKFASDLADRLNPPADSPTPATPLPPEWSEFVPELGSDPRDIPITKHNWGAFYGTELDLQLRRRHIRTLVLAGIATNMGVESTARDAYERGYEQVFVEDACATFSEEMHTFTFKNIFPRIGRVRSTGDVLAALDV
ncbi:MAG TPA: hydrolase [Thermoanaerobaculia bacterium]|jgi:nicotinamidase-related amidase|nr:hydrolase [Thermoanaerobaculia bacterium]